MRALATPMFSNHFPIYYLTLFRADTLSIGAFIAISENLDFDWVRARASMAIRLSGFVALVFGVLSSLLEFRTSANRALFNSLGYSLSAIFFGGVLVYVLGRRSDGLTRILAFGPLMYLGRVSYTFYLWHVAVLIELGRYFHSQAFIAMSALVLTTLLSAVSWEFAESPLLCWRSRETQPKDVALAA